MSSGYDEFPVQILKYVGTTLLKLLVHLVNSSFVSGVFPQQLKIAKIVPLYKKGEVTEIANYRPVSLLPTISKVFEEAMLARLVDFLGENKLFEYAQG